MTLPTTDQVLRWVGMTVHDDSGTEIGTCQNVYADDDTQVPEWIEVALPDDDAAMVPILGTSVSDDVLRLAHPADRVRQSPRYQADGLKVDDERSLYDHYGVAASEERSDTLLPAAARLPGDGKAEHTQPAPRHIRRLRRIEPTPTAPPPPPALPAPTSAPPSSGPDRKPLLALLAVPAGLLLARWLRERRRPAPAERGLGVAQRVAPVVAPLAAGAVALAVQRRRTRAAEPFTAPPELTPAPQVDVAVVAVAETPVVAEVPVSDVLVEEVVVDEVGTGQSSVPPVVPVAEVVDRDHHRPV
jgi:hypothetical protein